MGSVLAPLAFAHSASDTFWLAYARQNVVGRYPIGEIYPSGRKYGKEEIRQNVRGRAKKCRKLGLRSSLSMAPDGYTSPITLPTLVAVNPWAPRVSLRSHSARSRSTTLRPPANPRVLGFARMGGRNVVGRCPLGASLFRALVI